jgi:hypothetical protein
MSFSLQGLERVNGGLAFAATLWSYTTADDIASVEASDYFAEAKTFKVGDCILAVASDAARFYRITALSPLTIVVIDVGDTTTDPFTDPKTYANFAALPDVAANNDKCAITLSSQGVWMVNYKPAGLYYSNGVTWTYKGDYELTDAAEEIGFTPDGTISATDVQAAIVEVDDNTVDILSLYRILYSANGHTTAGNIAQTKGFFESGGQIFVVTAAQLAAAMVAPIRSGDFPAVAGKTPKLRVCGQVCVNATKPSSDFTFGLYRLTSPVGAAGVTGYTWTLVTGSQTSVISDPAASTITDAVSSDFDIPADGVYSLGVVTSEQIAASSNCHLSTQLQTRYV